MTSPRATIKAKSPVLSPNALLSPSYKYKPLYTQMKYVPKTERVEISKKDYEKSECIAGARILKQHLNNLRASQEIVKTGTNFTKYIVNKYIN